MAISAISSVAAAINTSAAQQVGGASVAPKASGDFGSVVVNALEGLQATQNQADNLAVKAASGDLNDVHDYMIAAAEASLATEYTVAVRNRAVEAFNEIMRMQV